MMQQTSFRKSRGLRTSDGSEGHGIWKSKIMQWVGHLAKDTAEGEYQHSLIDTQAVDIYRIDTLASKSRKHRNKLSSCRMPSKSGDEKWFTTRLWSGL